MTHLHSDQHGPSRMMNYLQQKEFIREMGPKKAALISGIFTTFERTRFAGVQLFKDNNDALIGILETTKYAEVRNAAANTMRERAGSLMIHELEMVLDNLHPDKTRETIAGLRDPETLDRLAFMKRFQMVAMERLGELGLFENIIGHYYTYTAASAAMTVLGKSLDSGLEDNALVLVATAHEDPDVRVKAAEKIGGRDVIMDLCARLSDDHEVARVLLGRLGASELLRVHGKTDNAKTKRSILNILARELESTSNPDVLMVLCYHEDEKTRVRAAQRIGSEEKRMQLAVRSRHPEVFAEAISDMGAARLWEVYKKVDTPWKKGRIDSRLTGLIDQISEDGILLHLLDSAAAELKDGKTESIDRLTGRLFKLVDYLTAPDLLLLVAARTNDQTLVEKAFARMKDLVKIAEAVVLTGSTETRDKGFALIKDDLNALARVAAKKPAIEGTDMMAIEALGGHVKALKSGPALEAIGTKHPDEKTRHAAIHRIVCLSYDVSNRLVGDSYDGYYVYDALNAGLKRMRIYERHLIDVRKNTVYPQTAEYARKKQTEIIDDWNVNERKCRNNMSINAKVDAMRALARSMASIGDSYSYRQPYSNAFQNLRMPGEGIFEALEGLTGRIL